MEDKINDESKKTSTHAHTTSTWYLVLRLIPAARWYSVFLTKHRAPLRGRLTPPATLAQGRMQLNHVKGAGRGGP